MSRGSTLERGGRQANRMGDTKALGAPISPLSCTAWHRLWAAAMPGRSGTLGNRTRRYGRLQYHFQGFLPSLRCREVWKSRPLAWIPPEGRLPTCASGPVERRDPVIWGP